MERREVITSVRIERHVLAWLRAPLCQSWTRYCAALQSERRSNWLLNGRLPISVSQTGALALQVCTTWAGRRCRGHKSASPYVLMAELRKQSIVTKVRSLKNGRGGTRRALVRVHFDSDDMSSVEVSVVILISKCCRNVLVHLKTSPEVSLRDDRM
jgi:hypothetical protein